MIQVAVIIPARLHSSRLPEKPLALLGGIPLIGRVILNAQQALKDHPNIPLIVATDSEKIGRCALHYGAEAVYTDSMLTNGTERVYHGARNYLNPIEHVINLQGDAPFIPQEALQVLIDACLNREAEYMTCASQLSWKELKSFEEHKAVSPTSGTSAIVSQGRGLWFSKKIIPHIRNVPSHTELSPVWRHLGIYAYHMDFLNRFVHWPESTYESIESLEQLRAIEYGHPPRVYPVALDHKHYLSIDTPSDLLKAQEYFTGAT